MPQLAQYPSQACLVLGAEDSALRTPVNAAAVIGEALGYGARVIAVPVDNHRLLLRPNLRRASRAPEADVSLSSPHPLFGDYLLDQRYGSVSVPAP